jgi:hypothetical protein
MTTAKPNVNASSADPMALITEVAPLMPHAHGINAGARSSR